MKHRVIGTLSNVGAWQRAFPAAKLDEIDSVLNGRKFRRWYKRNEKVIERTMFSAVPVFTALMFGIKPTLFYEMVYGQAVQAGAFGFLKGDGEVLLWLLGIGFFSMVVSAFLKFTGRGDLVPFLLGVSGIVVMIQIVKLFTHLYNAVSAFFTM